MIPERLAREVIYESDWVNLYADKVRFQDGFILDRHHLVHFDNEAVGIVILNEKDEVLLIKSPRYVTQSEEWEIPAGGVDPGESSDTAAAREVIEETGYEVNELKKIYKYNPSNGISDQVFLIYKALAGEKTGQFDTNEVSEIIWVSKDRIIEMLKHNEIRCGFSLTGLMLVLFCGL